MYLVLMVYEAASTITYCSVSLQQSPEWPSVKMKRIERDREEETEPVWTLCPTKSGSAQLVMENFTLCFSIDRPVNRMANLESARKQYKLKCQEISWFVSLISTFQTHDWTTFAFVQVS